MKDQSHFVMSDIMYEMVKIVNMAMKGNKCHMTDNLWHQKEAIVNI